MKSFKKLITCLVIITIIYVLFIKNSKYSKYLSFLNYNKPKAQHNTIVQDNENPFYRQKLTQKQKKCLSDLETGKKNRPANVKEEIDEFRNKINRMKIQAKDLYGNLSEDAKKSLVTEHELIKQLPKDVQKIYSDLNQQK